MSQLLHHLIQRHRDDTHAEAASRIVQPRPRARFEDPGRPQSALGNETAGEMNLNLADPGSTTPPRNPRSLAATSPAEPGTTTRHPSIGPYAPDPGVPLGTVPGHPFVPLESNPLLLRRAHRQTPQDTAQAMMDSAISADRETPSATTEASQPIPGTRIQQLLQTLAMATPDAPAGREHPALTAQTLPPRRAPFPDHNPSPLEPLLTRSEATHRSIPSPGESHASGDDGAPTPTTAEPHHGALRPPARLAELGLAEFSLAEFRPAGQQSHQQRGGPGTGDSEQVVNVTIGRIEIKTEAPPATPRAKKKPRGIMSLQDYLQQRNGVRP